MRCPKCQYIGFDSGNRCRNCGYEFLLAADEPPLDVTIGRDQPRPGRARDLTLDALETPLDRSRPPDGQAGGRRLPTAEDLPLFTGRVADDQAPLVTPPAVPRPPLGVRRSSPLSGSRARGRAPEESALDPEFKSEGAGSDRQRAALEDPAVEDAASIARRICAGLIDLSVLGTIAAVVVFLTLQICELTLNQWRVLPLVPLAGFLLLLCGGYFVLFTAAGGQTIGKMIAGIRVVAASDAAGRHVRVSFGASCIRAVAALGSVLGLGAGFLPVLFAADRRAFHDRVAETRVVSA